MIRVLILIGALLLSGCSLAPSYTPQQASAMIERVSREKYHLTVATRVIGQTLYASAQMPGFVGRLVASGNFARQDSDTIGDILVTTTQISLSADPPIQFYVLRLTDADASGAELRYVTYLDDIRRLYANALSEMEFFDRRIQELKASPTDAAMTDPWMEREVEQGEFLAVQLALRIKAVALQRGGDASTPGGLSRQPVDAALAAWHLEDCVGWFRNGVFSFAIVRSAPPGSTPEAVTWPKPVLELLARVLGEYGFTDYQRIVLTDTSTEAALELSPTELQAYYKPR